MRATEFGPLANGNDICQPLLVLALEVALVRIERGSTATRLLWVAAVGLLIAGVFGVATQSVAADDPPIQISTDVSPEQPLVDEPASIEVSLSNVESEDNRNVDIQTVYLREPGTANTYDRYSDVGTVGSGDSITVPLSTTFDSTGQHEVELRVTARYSDSDDSPSRYTYPVFVDVTDSELNGDVQLTSTEVSGNSDATIRGDASNIGGSDVESVLVSVNETAGVSPTSPNREYFVGEIEASEFGTFELTADIDSEIESVPVDVTYIVNGSDGEDERVTETQQIAIDSANSSTASEAEATTTDSGQTGGLPLIPLGVVILLVVGVGGLALWRRQ